MERRDFLRLASLTGLTVVAGPAWDLPEADAAPANPAKPLCLFVHAGGGWCPQDFCDPKGMLNPEETDPINKLFSDKEIATSGNIRHAPTDGIRQFFETHYKKLLVVNGIDTQTNSHDSGTRTTWAGTLLENKPALAALVASTFGPELAMSFITNGGYDGTGGLIPVTRMGNLDAIRNIAYPDIIRPGDENSARFRTEATAERIAAARKARYEAKVAGQNLPRIKTAMGALYASRLGNNALRKLTEFLPSGGDIKPGLAGQGQLAIAAYRAGATLCANLSAGGFDTHGNHDQNQNQALAELFSDVTDVVGQLEDAGVPYVLVMGSDFGRTPHYNSGNGKDHWSITSMMMMGQGISGNRVVGATTHEVDPELVDPKTLKVSSKGIRITTAHVQKALRKLLGVDKKFPMDDIEDMPILG